MFHLVSTIHTKKVTEHVKCTSGD